MKALFIAAALLSLTLFIAFPSSIAQAQLLDNPPAPAGAAPASTGEYQLENPLGTTSIPELVGRAISIFTGVSGSLALLMFVYGGVLWIFSGGSEERITKGKEVMKWATIGMLVMFSAYALVNLVFKGIGAA